MFNIYKGINGIINHGIKYALIDELDKIYVRNNILNILGLGEYEEAEGVDSVTLEDNLNNILDWAVEKGIIENTISEREILDSRIMGILVDRPSNIIKAFNNKYKISPKEATDYFYNLSKASNYIRTERVKKDLKWKANTKFGELDITVNMSKPEKDPKEIAKALSMPQGKYPKCLLCKEAEGYLGNMNYPGRSNHRIIPLVLNNEEWFLQYSPYVYFNEHSIVLKGEHTPMAINKATFIELIDFVDSFNHYFIGSNADLPIVGGSILSHDHYQSGSYSFAIENAKILESYKVKAFEGVEVQRVEWPLSVLRLRSDNKAEIVELADHILKNWRGYSDEEVEIKAHSGETPHNTITPIARFKEGKFELDLVLRNNRTTEEHPLGIFHPHKELHHIKKENIGLIEVMGLAVLPARLMSEMGAMKEYLINGTIKKEIESHKLWLDEIKNKYSKMSEDIVEENVIDIIKEEIGLVFSKVLEHCGVFKADEKGVEAFKKFVNIL